MAREDNAKKRKRDIKPEPVDFELVERQMRTHYGWLVMRARKGGANSSLR